MYAIEGNKLENVKRLLDCGAGVKKVDKKGETAQVLLGKYAFEKKKRQRNNMSIWERAGAT